jgi:hypothetical protein
LIPSWDKAFFTPYEAVWCSSHSSLLYPLPEAIQTRCLRSGILVYVVALVPHHLLTHSLQLALTKGTKKHHPIKRSPLHLLALSFAPPGWCLPSYVVNLILSSLSICMAGPTSFSISGIAGSQCDLGFAIDLCGFFMAFLVFVEVTFAFLEHFLHPRG